MNMVSDKVNIWLLAYFTFNFLLLMPLHRSNDLVIDVIYTDFAKYKNLFIHIIYLFIIIQ